MDDASLIGDYIGTIERNTEVLLNAVKDKGLAVKSGKTKYMQIGRHRGMIANAYEKVKTLKYSGSLLKNQNCIQEEIKFRLKAGINTFKYHVQLQELQDQQPRPSNKQKFKI